MKYFHNSKKKPLGFTLLEIIIVVIIVGVMATFGLPKYEVAVEKMRSQEGANVLRALWGAQKRYHLKNGIYTNDISNLDITLPALENFTSLTVGAGGNFPIASVQRNDSKYTYMLWVNANGDLYCVGDSLCTKLGYQEGAIR